MSGSNEKNNDLLQKTSSEVSMAAQEFPEWEVSGAMKRSRGSARSYFMECGTAFSTGAFPLDSHLHSLQAVLDVKSSRCV